MVGDKEVMIETEEDENKNEFDVNGVHVKVIEVGSTGTEIFAGTLQEEYLQVLQGTRAAEEFDKMRRSDPKVKMILSAMKNPIKSANWEVHERGDETREGEIQKQFIEHILFDGLGKTWKSFLHEALSCIDFGYSLFEVTYSAVLNHEVFGSYNGIRSLAFRSQKTIEEWNINEHEELECVYQQADGDSQRNVRIPAKYLLHFALEKEGNNFEGVSVLRPAYGPWLRKNAFLKYIAAGIEKYAIPIPILEIPEGKQGSKEYKLALNAMKRYVSHQCNYLTIPHGWNLRLEKNPFDASKIRDVINAENVEIVNAALANFLELGQSGSGSYALSFDLSDFFLGGLEYIAEQIVETINMKLIPDLIRLNFPDQKPLVELKVSGISDRAGEEFSKIVMNLINSGAIKGDDRLEEHLRKRYSLPEKDESSEREVNTQAGPQDPVTLAEKKQGLKKKSSDPVKKKIESDADKLKGIMLRNLKNLGSQVVAQTSKHWADSSDSQRVKPKATFSFKGRNSFEKEMIEELARQYNSAVDQVKKENKFFSNIKLSETENRIKLSETDKLSTKARNRIKGLTATLVGGNIDEIVKNSQLQYIQSNEATDSLAKLEQDIKDNVKKTVEGPMTSTGSLITASTMTNIARRDFFKEMQKSGEVESFTWINFAPVSEICQGIAGTTLPADHPDVDTYWPPLHHNCKTYVTANTSRTKDNPEPQDGFVPTKAQAKSITLADKGSGCC